MPNLDPPLTPAEVCRIFAVDPKTLVRWCKAGRLHPIRTPGGHRRYPADEVWALYGMYDARDKSQQR